MGHDHTGDPTAGVGLSGVLTPIDRASPFKSEFRYNNRENPYMFRDAMLKLLLAETLPYKKLIED